MITLARGADFNADPGQIKEVDDALAAALISGGCAAPAARVLDREAFEAAVEAASPPARTRRRATAPSRETR